MAKNQSDVKNLKVCRSVRIQIKYGTSQLVFTDLLFWEITSWYGTSQLVFTDLLFWEITSWFWEIIAKIIMVLASWIFGIACFFRHFVIIKDRVNLKYRIDQINYKVKKLIWLSNLKTLENWKWLVSFCFTCIRLTKQARPIDVDHIEQVQCTYSQPSSFLNVHQFQEFKQINVARTNPVSPSINVCDKKSMNKCVAYVCDSWMAMTLNSCCESKNNPYVTQFTVCSFRTIEGWT